MPNIPEVLQVIRHVPRDLYRLGGEAGVLKQDVTINSGSRDAWSSHTPTTRLRAGLAMGKITSSGKYAPVRRTTTDAAEASGQTTISVTSTEPFLTGQTVSISDGTNTTNLGAITAIAAGDTITVASGTSTAYASGSNVYVNDGSQTAVGLLLNTTDLQDDEGNITDANGTIIVGTPKARISSGQVPNYDATVASDMTEVIF